LRASVYLNEDSKIIIIFAMAFRK